MKLAEHVELLDKDRLAAKREKREARIAECTYRRVPAKWCCPSAESRIYSRGKSGRQQAVMSLRIQNNTGKLSCSSYLWYYEIEMWRRNLQHIKSEFFLRLLNDESYLSQYSDNSFVWKLKIILQKKALHFTQLKLMLCLSTTSSATYHVVMIYTATASAEII